MTGAEDVWAWLPDMAVVLGGFAVTISFMLIAIVWGARLLERAAS